MRQNFIKKCTRFFLQNAAILMPNATVNTKCDDYYKIRYLLQNESLHSVRVILQKSSSENALN